MKLNTLMGKVILLIRKTCNVVANENSFGLPENRKSPQINRKSTANQHNVILKPPQITGIYRVVQKLAP